MRIVIQEARSEAERRACIRLAARVHRVGPGGEPEEGWPERWLMAVAEGRLVGTVGLAGREACVRWFCGPAAHALAGALRASGAAELVELRFLSVAPEVRGYRFARQLAAAAHSVRFLATGGEVPAVLHCGPARVFRALERWLGVRSRRVAGAGPAGWELRLIVPEADVPEAVLEHPVPAELLGSGLPRPRPLPACAHLPAGGTIRWLAAAAG